MLGNARDCPVKPLRRSSAWVTVTNRAVFEELDAPESAGGGRAARKPARLCWHLGAFDSVEEPGHFNMEVAGRKYTASKSYTKCGHRLYYI